MRLPFVARDLYDAEVARTAHLEQRLADLMDAYTAMHERLLDALTQATKVKEPPKLPERTRDEVIDAILVRSNGNGLMRQHLAMWAMQQRRQQVPDEQILDRINNWESEDEDNKRGN